MPRSEYLKRKVIDESYLDDKKIYPGVTVEGLLVFPMVEKGSAAFKVIFPDVAYYDSENTVVRKKDFQFEFTIIYNEEGGV